MKTGYYSEVLFSMDIPFESSHEEKVRRCIDCRKVNDPRLCDKDGIEPNPENICKILEWPKNVTEVRQMLWMASCLTLNTYNKERCSFTNGLKTAI